MMTQEEYMDVLALKRQGWTITQIANEVGRHPDTVRRWLREGGPPPRRQFQGERIIDERWASRIDELLSRNAALLGTSIERILRAEGYIGSYPTLSAYLREVRGARRGKARDASVPIVTPPGEEAQFDWSDCRDRGTAWGLGDLHCFGAVLCWSRHRYWWFAPSIDRHHTFEGLVRFFESCDGVPVLARTDRMGALGQSQGRGFRWHAPALEFARYHGFAWRACAARDAKRKGKVERPFGELQYSFLAEMDLDPPRSIDELNRRTDAWLSAYVHPRPHRVTGEPPADRLRTERALLAPLPRMRFDTAYRETRRVGGAIPLIEWRSVAYSVPPHLVGGLVEVREPVDAGVIEIRSRGRVVATHAIAPAGADPVWAPEHRVAAEASALRHHRRDDGARLHVVSASTKVAELEGDFDVVAPDLASYGFASAHRPHPHPSEPPADGSWTLLEDGFREETRS